MLLLHLVPQKAKLTMLHLLVMLPSNVGSLSQVVFVSVLWSQKNQQNSNMEADVDLRV